MEIKRILWPTDFSERSEKALPLINSLIEKYQPEIHVMYVVDDLSYYQTWLGGRAPIQVEDITHKWKETAEEKLGPLCDQFPSECPLSIKHVSMGDPAQEILKTIDREEIDIVVMATRGAKGQFHYGSVTEKVVKNSPVPVLSVPA
jgi:nucleotide-binding universal stress UspA family protein